MNVEFEAGSRLPPHVHQPQSQAKAAASEQQPKVQARGCQAGKDAGAVKCHANQHEGEALCDANPAVNLKMTK